MICNLLKVDHIDNAENNILRVMSYTPEEFTLENMLFQCLDLISIHCSKLTDPYKEFYKASLENDWGKID